MRQTLKALTKRQPDTLATMLRRSFPQHTPRIIDRPRPSVAQVHTSASLRLKTCILNPDGSVASESPWRKNLILDIGLDDVAAGAWSAMTTYCHAGSGTDPFNRDSGSITVSVTSGVATASAGYFEAADVDRLLKLDTGEEYYVTAFTDTTHVDVTGADAAASECTIWYVNRTTLTTEVKRTNSLRTNSGDCGTTYNGGTRAFTHRRTHLFSVEVGSVTYREVGWGRPDSTTLFSGLVLSSPDNLVAGQQYMVISELVLTPSPTTSATAPDVATGGWNSEGDICIETIGSQQTNGITVFSSLGTTGTIFTDGTCEPSTSPTVQDGGYLNGTFTLQSPSSTSAISGTIGQPNSAGASSYVPGTFQRTKSYGYVVGAANEDWYGVTLGQSQFAGNRRDLTVHFDAPNTKDNTHTVTVTWLFTWGRTLVN